MNKIIIFLFFLLYIVSCEKQLNSLPAKEKKIKINVFNDKKIKEEIEVLDDDGMIYVDKKNLLKLLVSISDVKSVGNEENKVNFSYDDYKIQIDFKNKTMNKELIERKVDTKNGKIITFYENYGKNFKERNLRKKVTYNNNKISLYDVIDFLGMSMARDNVDCKEVMVAKGINDAPIFMTRKTNEASYKILKQEVDNLIKIKLVDKENRKYLSDNKEKFINNFYKEMIQFTKKINRGHFYAYAFENFKNQKMINNPILCGLKIGDKNYSEKNNTSVKFLTKDIAYMKINSFFGEDVLFDQFEKKFDSVNNCKNLIIDLRNNQGGAVVNELFLLSLLTNKELNEFFITEKGNKKYKVPDTSEKEYRGNLIILVNRKSMSASNTFINTIKIHKLGKIIGEKTGGLSDPIEERILPNGMKITKSTLRLYTDDKFERIEDGINPDIFVEDLAKGENKDPILTKALEILKN